MRTFNIVAMQLEASKTVGRKLLKQNLPHFVAESPWSDKQMLAKVRELVLPAFGCAPRQREDAAHARKRRC
jgi:SRSO17 transposase